MKYIALLLSFLSGALYFILPISYAETVGDIPELSTTWNYAVQNPLGSKDEIDGVSIDSEGNIIIGGLFSGKVQFGDTTRAAKKGSDMFIEKLDPDGKSLWFQQIDSGTNDFLWDLEVDSKGDIIISGGYGGTIARSTNPIYKTYGTSDVRASRDGSAFFAKLDGRTGEIIWVQAAGVVTSTDGLIKNPDRLAGGNEIKVDSKDNIIASMMASGKTVKIGKQNFKQQGHKDAFIMKLDTNGNFIWTHQFQGEGSKQLRALGVTGKDEIAFGFEHIGPIIGVKGEIFTTPSIKYPLGTFGMLLNSGTLLWMKGVQSSDYTNIRGAGGDAEGNVYFVGQVQDSLKVDGLSVPTTKNGSVLYMKYDRTGKKQWIKIVGSNETDGAGELVMSKDKKSFALTMTHERSWVNIYSEKGKILQSQVYPFTTKETVGVLGVFDLSGNMIASAQPKQSDQSTSGVLDASPQEGCFVYQLAFRGNMSFDNDENYISAGSKDKDAVISYVCPEKKYNLENIEKKYGDIYMDLSGKKGLILCFHGHGGSADAWGLKEQNKSYLENMKKEGYSYLCPTSLDRKQKKWSPISTSKNPDIGNIDTLLKELNISSSLPIFLLGHSNGGGFVGRFALISERKSQIAALQYSNSSGLTPAISYKDYIFPSVFMYSQCDTTVSYKDVEKNITLANKELGEKNVLSRNLDAEYQILNKKQNCHEFLDTSKYTIPFFEMSLQN